jgi:hypothetical protein
MRQPPASISYLRPTVTSTVVQTCGSLELNLSLNRNLCILYAVVETVFHELIRYRVQSASHLMHFFTAVDYLLGVIYELSGISEKSIGNEESSNKILTLRTL